MDDPKKKTPQDGAEPQVSEEIAEGAVRPTDPPPPSKAPTADELPNLGGVID